MQAIFTAERTVLLVLRTLRTLIIVGLQLALLRYVSLFLSLKIEQLGLHGSKCFDLFKDVSRIFIRQNAEKYSFEAEAL